MGGREREDEVNFQRGVEQMSRICETCGNEKKRIEGTPQQICTTPSCITMMILMLEKAGIK